MHCTDIKSFLKCLNVDNLWCWSKQCCIFDSIMRKFHLDIVEFPQNRVTEPFIWKWAMVIKTRFPVYRMIWLFWKESCDTCNGCNACLIDIPKCWKCSCEKSLKQLRTTKWECELSPWQYEIHPEWIRINVSDCFCDGYISYYRWPLKCSSLWDELCMEDELFIALEYLIMHEYSVRWWEFEKANFFSNMYQQTLKKIKDKDSTVPYAVWMSASLYPKATTSFN